MNSIRFRRLDKSTPGEQIRKALQALEDALFYSSELLPGHSFWLVDFDGLTGGVIGFYQKRTTQYFAFALYPEFRGGRGKQIFDLFYQLHCSDSFCVKTLDEERFAGADHLYSRTPMRRYQLGKTIIYINGGLLFRFRVLLLELASILRRKIQ